MPERKIKIILIEDSITVRTFYKNIFWKQGFHVIEAEDGKQGWENICDYKPDIVVLDMMLPDIPGIELLKQIRSTPSLKRIPILVLTSIKDIQHIQKVMALGANYYSVKGQDSIEKIQEIIYKLLRDAQQQKIQEEESGPDSDEEDEEHGAERMIWWV